MMEPWPKSLREVPKAALMIQTRERMANARADQWMNLSSFAHRQHRAVQDMRRCETYADERWCEKMAKRDQEMAIEAGRSPSALENA